MIADDFLLEMIGRDPDTGYRVLVARIVQRAAAKVRWIPPGGVARSAYGSRTVFLPAWLNNAPRGEMERCSAVAAHECGHLLAGKCPDREPHRRDPLAPRWWNCLKCEAEATRIAFDILPMTGPMHEVLANGLKSYIRSTPAADAVVREAKNLASDTWWRTYERLDRQRQAIKRHERQLQALRRY